jgi:hypothetical protein
MTGDVVIAATSKEQAENIIRNKTFIPQDLRNFYHLQNKIIECNKQEEQEEE